VARRKQTGTLVWGWNVGVASPKLPELQAPAK